MDTYSSGEDLVIKTRKPYTITKQRERWTEEEHNRFLEALKLYGRAWQRIEEHIGTKTAVQIRSHAQKFFSKLEKEALSKGVPIGQAHDIDIPPPRPKRKPSNPYPRKTGIGAPAQQWGAKDGKKILSSVSSSVSTLHLKQVLDLEQEPPPERPNGDEKTANTKENQDDNCSEILTLFQEVHCSSMSSVNKKAVPTSTALRNSCTFTEFVYSTKDAVNQDERNESYVTVELEGNQKFNKADSKQLNQDDGTGGASNLNKSCPFAEKPVQGKEPDDFSEALAKDETQSLQNYPRHVPVHVLDGNLGTAYQTPADMSFENSILHPVGEVEGQPHPFANPAASATNENQNHAARSSPHQSFPTFHPPFTTMNRNQDDYQSFLHMSSTFSSLIVSTLLQNPAAHAAASFAATFWPYTNVEASADSPACVQGGFPPRQMNSAPSMAAIAAATVAAATAWWASHGLPLCAPLHNAFACTAPSSSAVQSLNAGQALAAKTEGKEKTPQNPPAEDQPLGLEHFEAMEAQLSASKSQTVSTSDSEESEGAKLNTGSKAADHEKATAANEPQDSNKTTRKQVDRSSCGSNTPSSSDVEIDALENNEKGKEETKEADAIQPSSELANRRTRSISITSDSWKEVSEEGRLAFQALFSREVLPQSFSPPHKLKNKGHLENVEESSRITSSLLDLNSKTLGSCSVLEEAEKSPLLRCEHSGDVGLLTIGLGPSKLKTRRTGFKPYKRCSMEAKESKLVNPSGQGDEKGPKRIRLDGEAST